MFEQSSRAKRCTTEDGCSEQNWSLFVNTVFVLRGSIYGSLSTMFVFFSCTTSEESQSVLFLFEKKRVTSVRMSGTRILCYGVTINPTRGF